MSCSNAFNHQTGTPEIPLLTQPVLEVQPALEETGCFGVTRHEIKEPCTCGICSPAEFVSNHSAAERLLKGRMLVLVDHENLISGPSASAARSAWAWHRLKDALMITNDDSVIIGLSRYSLRRFMTSLPLRRVQIVVGDGPDGADHALIDSVDVTKVAEQYDYVVIASGDHIFANLACELRQAGCRVVNAFPAGRGSFTLRHSVDFTMSLRGLRTRPNTDLAHAHARARHGLEAMILAA